MNLYTIALGVFGLLIPQIQNQSEPELMMAGWLQPGDVIGKTGDTWLGLYATKEGYELMQTTITVNDSEWADGIMVKYVNVNRHGEPIFLIRGIPSLSEGLVRGSFYGKTEITPRLGLRLKLDDLYDLLAVNDTQRDGGRIFRITLKKGSVYQIIASIDDMDPEGTATVLWAGDLDRDGKLDHFFYFSDGKTFRGGYTLFLSSQADEGKLVKRVVSFSVQGE